MERFKDFLYSKNDIVVAFIILLLALTLISFRIKAIMEYPKTLADEQSKAIENVQDNKSKDSDKKDKDADEI